MSEGVLALGVGRLEVEFAVSGESPESAVVVLSLLP